MLMKLKSRNLRTVKSMIQTGDLKAKSQSLTIFQFKNIYIIKKFIKKRIIKNLIKKNLKYNYVAFYLLDHMQ